MTVTSFLSPKPAIPAMMQSQKKQRRGRIPEIEYGVEFERLPVERLYFSKPLYKAKKTYFINFLFYVLICVSIFFSFLQKSNKTLLKTLFYYSLCVDNDDKYIIAS